MLTYKQYNLDIKRDVRLSIQSIYGIGWLKSIFICSKLGLAYPYTLNALNLYNYFILTYMLDFFT